MKLFYVLFMVMCSLFLCPSFAGFPSFFLGSFFILVSLLFFLYSFFLLGSLLSSFIPSFYWVPFFLLGSFFLRGSCYVLCDQLVVISFLDANIAGFVFIKTIRFLWGVIFE